MLAPGRYLSTASTVATYRGNGSHLPSATSLTVAGYGCRYQGTVTRYRGRERTEQSRMNWSSNRHYSAVPLPPFAGGADCRHEPEAAG
ncbi:unnamed protein product [Cuscuta campestris]|uniref:Uncharacterized protein n=1 Tax=Cuscuta campestris TaxID=132261 RepID=A0A484LBQ4_9ASTE|nr:unnamed protein product [Cuscuta campestris]